VDIGAIAREFSGGGHKNAAGCTVIGPIDGLQQKLVKKVEDAVERQEGGRPAHRR
jgi:phosphoesterase RecJ-like protein